MCLVSLSQVVREVLLDVLDEVVRVLRIEVQHLIESFQVDTLQVTVGQGFHICIGFYYPVIQGQVCSDQVTFTCSGRESEMVRKRGDSIMYTVVKGVRGTDSVIFSADASGHISDN